MNTLAFKNWLCSGLLLSILVTPPSTRADIVAQWSFEDDLEDTAPAGVSGDDLEPFGDEAYVDGVVGRAVNLTAEGLQRLRAADSDDLDLAESWTLEAFVWPDDANSGEWDRFWTKWGDGGNEWHTAFRSTGAVDVENGLDLFINGGNNILNSNSTAEVPLEEWSHVAFVGNADAGTITAWLNGEEVGSADYEPVNPGAGAVNFGNFDSPANPLQYSGYIDEALIHNAAVSEDYLLNRTALINGGGENVVSRWSFEDNLADSATAGESNDALDAFGDPEYANGIVGRAVNITSGGLQRLRSEDAPDLNLADNWTLEAFVRPDADNTGEWDRFWTKWEGGAEWHWAFRSTGAVDVDNGLDLFINGANSINSNDTKEVPLERWSHVALVGNMADDTITAWLNGEMVAEAPYEFVEPTTAAMNFGNFQSPGNVLQYSGLIDEAMIHNAAVTPDYLSRRAGLLITGDPEGDDDGDGLTNAEEAQRGTNPKNPDTDADGYNDGVENNTGTWASAEATGTNPNQSDSDGDGLLDGVENPALPFVDENQTGTDPNVADTDGDGVGDGLEVDNGSDPTDKESKPDGGAIVARWSFEDNLEDTAPGGVTGDDLDPTGEPEYAPGVPGLGGRAVNITSSGLQRLRSTTSADLNLAENWTLEAFVWPDADNGGEWDRFWTKWEGGPEWHWAFRSTGAVDVENGLDLFINGANAINSNDTAEVPLEKWSHVALVGNMADDTITAWLNGEMVAETPYEFVEPTAAAMNFGNFQSPGNVLQYSGLIDEALIHAVAVDEAYLVERAALRIPGDPDGDSDGDGLTNAKEADLGTDPNNPDTDGDGLNDGIESNTGVWASTANTGTDPRLKDTDGDGLADNVENPDLEFVDASQPGTDPNNADTDGDQTGDGDEIANGTDPTKADPFSLKIVSRWSFDGDLADSAPAGTSKDDLDPTGEPEYDTGILGQAVRLSAFEGLQRLRAENSDDLNLAPNWSLEAFVWPDADNAGEWDRFWTKWGDGGAEWHLAFRSTGAVDVENGIDFFINGGNNIVNSNNTAEVLLEEWSHIVVVGSSSTGKIAVWLNGEQVGESDYEATAPGGSAMNFGNFDSPSNALQYSGLIDEAVIHANAVPESYIKNRARLLEGAPAEIVETVVDRPANKATITWTSTQGREYAIEWSRDLQLWFELDDGIPGADGETTSYEDTTIPPEDDVRYYRVREGDGG